MVWNPLEKQAVIRNLKDAGCSDEAINHFMTLWEEATQEKQLKYLRLQRSYLLDSLHTEQRKLDCLDYLIYQLQLKQ